MGSPLGSGLGLFTEDGEGFEGFSLALKVWKWGMGKVVTSHRADRDCPR